MWLLFGVWWCFGGASLSSAATCQTDLWTYTQVWRDTTSPSQDHNGNGRIDVTDMVVLLNSCDDAAPLFTVTVANPSAFDRTLAPVRSGVPFPRGLIADPNSVSLFDGAVPLPLQTRLLSRWDDGSVRWLLLESQIDITAGAEKTLAVRQATPTPVTTPLTIEETNETIRVDTGPLQVVFAKQHGGVFEEIRRNGQLVLAAPNGAVDRGPWLRFSDRDYAAQNLTPSSQPLSGDAIDQYRRYVQDFGLDGSFNLYDPWQLQVVIEEQGPLQTTLRFSGTHLDSQGNSFCSFITRCRLYRGSDQIHVEHSLVFTGAKEDQLQGFGFRLPVTGTQTLIEEHAMAQGEVRHLSYGTHEITGQATQNGQARGVMGRGDQNQFTAVALDDMAQTYPKALRATADTLSVDLYPLSSSAWDLSRYADFIDTANRETGDARDRGAQGLATVNQFRLRFGAEPMTTTHLHALSQAAPLHLVLPPAWVSDSNVLGIGPFHFSNDVQYEVHHRIDTFLKIIVDFMLYNQQIQFEWFGITTYGDIRGRFSGGRAPFTWHELGRYGWSGNSGEPLNQLWVQVLRDYRPEFWHHAMAFTRHTANVQMVHYGDASRIDSTAWNGRNREFAVGSLHRHGRQAWSGYAGTPEYSHVAGLETAYYLTGDLRARDALYEAAQFMVRYGPTRPDYTALVNGLDVLSRAEAVFHDDPTSASRFRNRITTLTDYLTSGAPNPVQDELDGANAGSSFGFFVRGAPGLLYEHARTGDAALAGLIFDAADILVDGPDGDAWGIADDGEEGSAFYFLNTLTYAATIAPTYQRDPQPYTDLARRILAWNAHINENPGTGAISQTSLDAVPAHYSGWSWRWDEDPLPAESPGILWIDRQLTYRNDFMQDYHSYRALLHLAVAAALIPEGTVTGQ